MRAEADAIAWIGEASGQGRWGTPQTLQLPISDRGLLLADGLFETLLVSDGQAWLLAEHLARWQASAALLGLPPPPAAGVIAPLIDAAITRSGLGAAKASSPSAALRLNWSRGSGAAHGRGIDLPDDTQPRLWLQLSLCQPNFTPVQVIVSPTEERSATSLLSRCKTFAYGPAIQARRQARAAGADDALLRSSAGGLSSGTSATLLVRREGHWLTPPLSSGCLPGVMRQRALDRDQLREGLIAEQDLANGDAAWLLNSLGCRPISHLAGRAIGPADPDAGAAETFWRQLLQPTQLQPIVEMR